MLVNEKSKKRFLTLKRQEAALGWLFVSPALIGFSIFTFGSILYSLYTPNEINGYRYYRRGFIYESAKKKRDHCLAGAAFAGCFGSCLHSCDDG